MVLFRIGHPALFIPWQDITAEERSGFFFPVVALQFLQVPGVTLSLPRKLWEKLQKARHA
jgi:hypothetical protein